MNNYDPSDKEKIAALQKQLNLAHRCISQIIEQNKIYPGWYFTTNDQGTKETLGNFRVLLGRSII